MSHKIPWNMLASCDGISAPLAVPLVGSCVAACLEERLLLLWKHQYIVTWVWYARPSLWKWALHQGACQILKWKITPFSEITLFGWLNLACPLSMYLSWFTYKEASDQQRKCSGAWGFHHRGLVSEMGVLYKVKYCMLLYKPLQISHLSPILIVPSQEKLMKKLLKS